MIRIWPKGKRFDVVQVQNGKVVMVHTRNVTHRRAVSDAAHIERMLLFCKLAAPSGPQDAHAHIVPARDGDAPCPDCGHDERLHYAMGYSGCHDLSCSCLRLFDGLPSPAQP